MTCCLDGTQSRQVKRWEIYVVTNKITALPLTFLLVALEGQHPCNTEQVPMLLL
jgi:hypothetical protein